MCDFIVVVKDVNEEGGAAPDIEESDEDISTLFE